MAESDAAPLPREGEIFFDVRGDARSMRLSWYADSRVAVFSIWQGDRCTGTFRLPFGDLARMAETLQRGPRPSAAGAGGPAHGIDVNAPPGATAHYPAQAGYPDRRQLASREPFLDTPRYADGPDYADAPSYTGGPSYTDAPSYAGAPRFAGGPNYAGVPNYADEPNYADARGYSDVPSYAARSAVAADRGYDDAEPAGQWLAAPVVPGGWPGAGSEEPPADNRWIDFPSVPARNGPAAPYQGTAADY